MSSTLFDRDGPHFTRGSFVTLACLNVTSWMGFVLCGFLTVTNVLSNQDPGHPVNRYTTDTVRSLSLIDTTIYPKRVFLRDRHL